MARRARKPTNLTIDSSLVEEARSLDINLSQTFEEHLRELIRKRRAEKWLLENRAAFERYNAYLEAHGIWNEDERGW
jgi:antitoxin CcdA